MIFVNRITSIISLFIFSSTLSANALFQPGNILASSQNVVYEYDATTGSLINQIAIPLTANNEVARDITVLDDGRLAVFNGTFYPELAIYDGVTWQSMTVAGWSIPNNTTYGGIVSIANKVFVTDGFTYNGGEARGIIAIDLNDGTSNRFISDKDYIDIALGGDGLLYALQNTYGVLDVIDPVSLAIVRSVALGHTSSSRGVTANANGDIFMASLDGYVAQYDSAGTVLNSLTINNYLHDVELDDTGRLVVSRAFGQFYVTDDSLSTFSETIVSSASTFIALVPAIQPPAPPVLNASHFRKGKWITTTLNWTTDAPEVDIYYNNQLISTLANDTTATYVNVKHESQAYFVCNAGTQDCSDVYIAN